MLMWINSYAGSVAHLEIESRTASHPVPLISHSVESIRLLNQSCAVRAREWLKAETSIRWSVAATETVASEQHILL